MIKVYYLDISNAEFCDLDINNLCFVRKNYVASIVDMNRKKQSYFVWKLLEYVLNLNGYQINDAKLKDNGEWEVDCPIKFSLSHSKNLVVVAISENSIGVDTEAKSDKLIKLKNKYYIEKKIDYKTIDDLGFYWTEKESKIKAKTGVLVSRIIAYDCLNTAYYISVCGCEKCIEFDSVNFKDIKE